MYQRAYGEAFMYVNTRFKNSMQRSADIPLGINFNQVQVFVLFALIS